MAQFSLNDTWKYCLEMWSWIIEHPKKECESSEELKVLWLKNNHPNVHLRYNCFFCDYAGIIIMGGGKNCISKCPAKLIDEKFYCCNDEYHYFHKPIKFYEKLIELNEIRLERKGKMTETEINQKIQQCETEIATSQKKLDELRIQKGEEEKREPRWLIAKTKAQSRIILNLAQLSDCAKERLRKAIIIKEQWISFDTDSYGYGTSGTTSHDNDGLTFYRNSEIIV